MSHLKKLGWLLIVFAPPVFASTIVVGPPPASIQTAINSATDGDTIQLSPGIYQEEIQVVSKSLSIVGAGENSTTIQAPDATIHLTQNFTFSAVAYWCVVMIDNQAAPTAQGVDISNLSVDGNTQQDTVLNPFYGSSDRFFAIGYHNAGGTVQNVHTTNTRQTSSFNEMAGGGIVNASDTGTVVFNITSVLVDFYQRQGIDARGAALTANISNSTINRGYVLTPNTSTATPNGIQYSVAATGSISNNTIESNISTIANASATGILPFGAGAGLLITNNTISNNDFGIAAIQCGNGLAIDNNTLDFTTIPGVNSDEGIVVQDTNGTTVIASNIMNSIPNVDMDLSATTDQPFMLSGNQFTGSQTGLLVTGNTTVGPVITMSNDVFSGTSGMYIQEVTSPNDIWPSTASVTFDGMISAHITLAQFNQILTRIFDEHNDPALGLVLDFLIPAPPSLNQAFNPSAVDAGMASTLTITLSNSDAAAATLSAVFVDSLPANLFVASPPNASTTCFGGALSANAGDTSFSLTGGANIPANTSCTITVDVSSAVPASYTNTIPTDALQTDLGNNDADSNATLTVNAVPHLTLSKTAGSATFVAGQNASYILGVSNSGSGATTTVTTITDVLPNTLTLVNLPAGCSNIGSTVSCTIPAGLAAGTSTSFTLLVMPTAAAAGNSITNSASLVGGGDNGCPNAARCASAATTAVTAALVPVQIPIDARWMLIVLSLGLIVSAKRKSRR